MGPLLIAVLPTIIKTIGGVIVKKAPELKTEFDEKAKAVEGAAPDRLREHIDDLIDWVENKIVDSANKLDDKVLPVINIIRAIYDIPDDIGGDQD